MMAQDTLFQRNVILLFWTHRWLEGLAYLPSHTETDPKNKRRKDIKSLYITFNKGERLENIQLLLMLKIANTYSVLLTLGNLWQ